MDELLSAICRKPSETLLSLADVKVNLPLIEAAVLASGKALTSA